MAWDGRRVPVMGEGEVVAVSVEAVRTGRPERGSHAPVMIHLPGSSVIQSSVLVILNRPDIYHLSCSSFSTDIFCLQTLYNEGIVLSPAVSYFGNICCRSWQ